MSVLSDKRKFRRALAIVVLVIVGAWLLTGKKLYYQLV